MPNTTTEQNQGNAENETMKQANDEKSQKTSATQDSAPKSPLRHDFITTLAATLSIPPYSMLICMFVYGCLLYASIHWSWAVLRTLLIVYMSHAVLLDRTAQAATKPNWVEKVQSKCNKNVLFRLTAKYFSCKLHPPPSHKFDPDQPYLFTYHPHGIIGMGASLALATDASGFSTIFPGVRGHTCILCFDVLTMMSFLTVVFIFKCI